MIFSVVFPLFYDELGKVKWKQFCVPETVWREIMFRLHSSTSVLDVGTAKAFK